MAKVKYAILTTEKVKRNNKNLREISAHVDRSHKKAAVNAAFHLSFQNQHYNGIQNEWVDSPVNLISSIDFIIDKKCIIEKKDNVIVQQFILTACNEFFNPDGQKFGQWDDCVFWTIVNTNSRRFSR